MIVHAAWRACLRQLLFRSLVKLFIAGILFTTLLLGSSLARADCNDEANRAALACLSRYKNDTSNPAVLSTCRAEQNRVGNACLAKSQRSAEPCDGVTTHIEGNVCWAMGITRDDCRDKLHGETRERDGYQYCAFNNGTKAQKSGELCDGVTTHIEGNVCWAMGITRDDCRNKLHGETREQDGYQYCAFNNR
jgi:hypothetical protein